MFPSSLVTDTTEWYIVVYPAAMINVPIRDMLQHSCWSWILFNNSTAASEWYSGEQVLKCFSSITQQSVDTSIVLNYVQHNRLFYQTLKSYISFDVWMKSPALYRRSHIFPRPLGVAKFRFSRNDHVVTAAFVAFFLLLPLQLSLLLLISSTAHAPRTLLILLPFLSLWLPKYYK